MRLLIILIGLGAASNAWAQPRVFACEPEWAELAREIGRDHISVYSATTALQDPHRIQARPSLIAAYRNADLLVCTGADLEIGWLPALAQKGNNPRVLPGRDGNLMIASLVQMAEVPDRIDRAQGDVHPQGNPHVQTNPHHFVIAARAVAERLSVIDPQQRASYAAALTDFELRWSAAVKRWEEKARPLKGLAVVSAHQSFPYLYTWLGIEEVATLEAKPGVEASVGHLQQVLTQLKQRPARMVVYAAYQSDRSARWLSKRAAIPIVKLPFSPGGMPGADDLFGLFDVTIEQLLAAGEAP